MAFTGPGPDAFTLTLPGLDAWAVTGLGQFGLGTAGGVGEYTLRNSVPEPATLALLGFGLAGVGASRFLRKT